MSRTEVKYHALNKWLDNIAEQLVYYC